MLSVENFNLLILMANSRSSLFLVFLLFVAYTNAQVDPICTPEPLESDDPEAHLPQLPSQYFVAIEAVLVERNATDFVAEYYDDIGNRGRADFIFNGTKVNSVWDYDLGEIFIYPNPRTGDDCTVSLLNVNNTFARFFFGLLPGPNNTVHIGRPTQLFGYDYNNTVNYTYVGVHMTRDIPCHHWRTCTNTPNASFTLDYYFTDNRLWRVPYPRPDGEGYVPVQVVLNGSVIDRRTGLQKTTLHYYNFVEFNSGPDAVPDSAFDIPLDLVCKGRLPGQPLPQFSDFFTAGIEFVYNNTATNFLEYYDYTHQLLRIDGYTTDPSITGVIGPYSLIHDFNIGAQYTLSLNDRTCMVQPLNENNTASDGMRDSTGELHLRSIRSLLLAGPQYDFVYEGVTTVRGMPVDVWQSYRDQQTFGSVSFTNITYLLYMTRPGVDTSSPFGFTTDPVLVQTKFAGVANGVADGNPYSVNVSFVSSVFAMSPTEPPLDVFATLSCFSPSDYQVFQFSVPPAVGPVNQQLFKSNVRSAFLDYAKSINMSFLTPLQVNNIQINTQSVPNATVVSLFITNIPANATKKWNFTAQDFVSRLTDGLSNGDQLPFTIRFNGSSLVEVQPLFINNTNEPSCPFVPPPVCPTTSCPIPTATSCSPTTSNTFTCPTISTACSTTTTINTFTCHTSTASSTPTSSASPACASSVGITTGVSIGSLIVGVIIGLVVGIVLCFFVQRYKKKGGFKLLPSKNDLQFDELTT